MSQPAVRRPDVTRKASDAARALTVGLRAWSLYPSDHPALAMAVDRLVRVTADVTRDGPLMLLVTPQSLLIDGTALDHTDPIVAECARTLYELDILQLSFISPSSDPVIRKLLGSLTIERTERRTRGGPASIWAEHGASSIVVEQIDYRELLEREGDPGPARRDQMWQSIVRSIVAGRRTFTEGEQSRLLEIAHDAAAVGELADDCRQAYCSSDGSPLLTTQAATVLAVYRHLAATVRVLEPERADEVLNKFALATSSLEPALALEVLQAQDAADELQPITAALKRAFDEQQVALLLARAMARAGGATRRLAQILDTLAPDEERRERVLKMADKLLTERDFGATRPLADIRASLEELLLKYDESPYVSDAYRQSMNTASDRATEMAARDLPPELGEWVATLGHDNVRHLSGQLLIDLMNLETDDARAAELAGDMSTFAQEVLIAGAYEEACRMVAALRAAMRRPAPIAPDALRDALQRVAHSEALREVVTMLGEIGAAQLAHVTALCRHLGPKSARALMGVLHLEHGGAQGDRAADILVSLGPEAIAEIGQGIDDKRWWIQRNLAQVLGRIGTAAAVPPLQVLLKKADARVLPTVLKGLSRIDDPAAARAIHTVLRAVNGHAREVVVATLVGLRDLRVVPMIARIIDESDVLGRDFDLVLQSLDAIASFKDDRAVRPITTAAGKRRWLAPRRTRRMRERAVHALAAIGSRAALNALDAMRLEGDWHLRRVVRRAPALGAGA
jgi:HEAT repeat protein